MSNGYAGRLQMLAMSNQCITILISMHLQNKRKTRHGKAYRYPKMQRAKWTNLVPETTDPRGWVMVKPKL
jgi:hypothetical protein